MPIERGIEVLAVIHFFGVGLSHIAQPGVWTRFFVQVRERGKPGVLGVGLMSLAFGSLIVAFHNVWSGIPAVLTVMGWAQVAKGTVYLLAPGFGLRRLETVRTGGARLFVIPGVLFVVLALLLAYHLAVVDPGDW